jgi:hypothetical protein
VKSSDSSGVDDAPIAACREKGAAANMASAEPARRKSVRPTAMRFNCKSGPIFAET